MGAKDADKAKFYFSKLIKWSLVFSNLWNFLFLEIKPFFIQIYNISDEKTFEREYSPFLAIRDAYPKMIIARTHHETYDYKGVQVVDICRWLRE